MNIFVRFVLVVVLLAICVSCNKQRDGRIYRKNRKQLANLTQKLHNFETRSPSVLRDELNMIMTDSICNETITLSYFKNLYVVGGWSATCQPHHISFESCKVLLRNSTSCNAAYYHNKVCHLLVRTVGGSPLLARAKAMRDDSQYGVRLLKSTHGIDHCQFRMEGTRVADGVMRSLMSAREALRWCNEQSPQYNNTYDMFDQLPRVNVVVSATSNWVDRNPSEFKMVVCGVPA
jgi:hypothetical protein